MARLFSCVSGFVHSDAKLTIWQRKPQLFGTAWIDFCANVRLEKVWCFLYGPRVNGSCSKYSSCLVTLYTEAHVSSICKSLSVNRIAVVRVPVSSLHNTVANSLNVAGVLDALSQEELVLPPARSGSASCRSQQTPHRANLDSSELPQLGW